MSIPTYRGTQIPVITLPPDWTSPVALKVEEKTAIFEALDLSEERHQKFPRGLFGVEFTSTAIDARTQGHFRKLFETAQALPMGVPIWPESVRLEADVLAGSEELPVTPLNVTALPLFERVILWSDWQTWEMVTISVPDASEASTSTLPLSEPLTLSWPGGTLVIPVGFGYCKRPDFESFSGHSSGIPIAFRETWHGVTRQDLLEIERVEIPSSITMSECKDLITFRWDGSHDPGISGNRCWIVEAKVGADGAWGEFAIVRGAPPIDDRYFEMVIENVWEGDFFIRALNFDERFYNGRYYGTTTQRPPAPTVTPPSISVTNATLLATINQLTGAEPDALQRFSTFPKPGNNEEMPFVSPDDVFRTPSSLYQYDKAAGWDGVPNIVSVTHEDPGVILRWTRDDSNPTLAGSNPGTLDGHANNAGFYRDDSKLIIRARAFKNGCHSAQRILVCDVRRPIFDSTQMNGKASSGGYTCENARFHRTQDTGQGLPTDCVVVSSYPGNNPRCSASNPPSSAAIINACANAATGGDATQSGPSERYFNKAEVTQSVMIGKTSNPEGCNVSWSDGDSSTSADAYFYTGVIFNRPLYFDTLPNPFYHAYAQAQVRVRESIDTGVENEYRINPAGTIIATITSERVPVDQTTHPPFGPGGVGTGVKHALEEALGGHVISCEFARLSPTARFWSHAWIVTSRYNKVLYTACNPPV